MGKDCQSCVKEGIGCESVQKMMHGIDELKRAKAHCGFFITFTVLFVLFAGMLIYNTWPQKVKDSVISINVVEAKEKTAGDEVQISKSALEDTLQKSAYAARREAQIEYDRNFSTLLTILTIFGIAWPLIVAFAQYKFNERELDKIQEARKDAESSLNEAKEAKSKAEEAQNKAQTALEEVKDTDVWIKKNHEFVMLSNRRHWDVMYLAYTKAVMVRGKNDNKIPPSLSNFNTLMAAYCLLCKIAFGQFNKLEVGDANRIQVTTSKRIGTKSKIPTA